MFARLNACVQNITQIVFVSVLAVLPHDQYCLETYSCSYVVLLSNVVLQSYIS